MSINDIVIVTYVGDVLFFKVWRNIVIRRQILKETKLYMKHSKCRIFTNTRQLCQYKYIGYVTQVFLSSHEPFIDGFKIPLNIKSLHLGRNLRQDLVVGDIPNSITRLSFKRVFRKSIISKGCIPPNVTQLDLGDGYVLPFKDKQLNSNSVCKLKIGFTHFTDNPDGGPQVIPKGIKSITFGYRFDSEIVPWSFENGTIEILKFGCCFDQILKPNSIPSTIKTLWFGRNFNSQIDPGVLPNGIETLRFGKNFNCKLDIGCIPSSVTTLQFGKNHSKPVIIPLSVTTLMIGDGFLNQISTIPNSVESLIFCNDFSKEFDLSIIPSTIKSISINNNYIYLPSLLISNVNNNFKINLIN